MLLRTAGALLHEPAMAVRPIYVVTCNGRHFPDGNFYSIRIRGPVEFLTELEIGASTEGEGELDASEAG